jgi:hypothetical protein
LPVSTASERRQRAKTLIVRRAFQERMQDKATAGVLQQLANRYGTIRVYFQEGKYRLRFPGEHCEGAPLATVDCAGVVCV